MLDQNVIDNQTKLREEIKEIKEYLSLIEHEVNSSGHVERLSDHQFRDIWKRLRTINNFAFGVNYFWAKFTGNKELEKKLVGEDLKETLM